MKIFILDDDKNVIRIIKKIINDRDLGTVIGEDIDGEKGYEKIVELNPDLVIVDLLMPGMDGITIVRDLKKVFPQMEFIMISQVSSKDMVGRAYKYGVEYYIYKPVNALEVESIIKKVQERIKIDRVIDELQFIFQRKKDLNREEKSEEFCEQCIKNVLMRLGIIGEKGSKDIIDICRYIVENNLNFTRVTLRGLCKEFSKNPKSMEQRMRRTIAIAMSNIANLGVEDYMNEIFVEYSSSLFKFEQVKKEMDYIRGKVNRGGSVNIMKFIKGLILYCENINN
ncbi:response regulator [Clostridiisalibacter paucivorans]|uniref:response regulator n=1 Tax=Clostridiisalibacter paucivorans TaxID=408753 RepID=UPI00047CA010|nr:response regulator [Clostridiisalibacter paucivorans]